jgi:alpha-glucosidase
MQSLVQYTSQKPGDTLSVHIYNGNTLNSFVYYEDDGESYGYEKGIFYKRTITFDPVKKVVEFDTAEGSFPSGFNTIKMIMHGFPGTNDFYSFMPAVSAFDPEKQQQNTNPGEAVKCLYHKNQAEKFLIRME